MGVRASELAKKLEKLGFEWCYPKGGGSHFQIKRDGQRTVPISLHNGMRDEVSRTILKKLAKQLGIDPSMLID